MERENGLYFSSANLAHDRLIHCVNYPHPVLAAVSRYLTGGLDQSYICAAKLLCDLCPLFPLYT